MGIGSYTYQYNTRDTFGFAMKATYGEIKHMVGGLGNDYVIEPLEIWKDPITDDGTKKSAKGLLQVTMNDKGDFILHDRVSKEEEKLGFLEIIFEDGKLLKDQTLQEIRNRLCIQ